MATQTRMSITISPALKTAAHEIAKENNTSVSRLVSQCLEALARQRKQKLLIKYYRDMADEHNEFAEKSANLVQSVASSWGD